MILQSVIANLTRNLDVICLKKGVSSQEKLKDDTLRCLMSVIESAPDSEFIKLIKSEEHEILLGYLLSILCRLAKNEKSRILKLQALELIESLIGRLGNIHCQTTLTDGKCSVITVILALPGVTSTLFRLIMSDTKLPSAILVKSIQTLGKVITTAFLRCEHNSGSSKPTKNLNSNLIIQDLTETCENLAVRIAFLIDYIITHSNALNPDVKCEMLNLCKCLVIETKLELLTRSIKSIVRYMAFAVSSKDQLGPYAKDVDLKILLLSDNINHMIRDVNNLDNRLDKIVLACILDLLKELDANCLKMLDSERQANLSMLNGYLSLLPQEVLTTFFEETTHRDKFFDILTNLCQFNLQQPFLPLTETRVGSGAIELRDGRMYTTEKRFAHLSEKEVTQVNTCCQLIGRNAEWSFLCDIIKNDLIQFSSASKLYITHQVLKGCMEIVSNSNQPSKFTSHVIESYIDSIKALNTKINLQVEESIQSKDALTAVIAIESLVTLIHIHLNLNRDNKRRVLILKILLYPLLTWCSSKSRAVSETALNVLTQIGSAYGYISTKDFIKENIDYIVDSATKMLDHFIEIPAVMDALAITFKLSSIESFHFFRDVYDRVFRVLARYHHTELSRSIVLFFLRTLTILEDWIEASNHEPHEEAESPLDSETGVFQVLFGLDIDRRITKLINEIEECNRIDKEMGEIGTKTRDDEKVVLDYIKSGQADIAERYDQMDDPVICEQETPKKPEIVLTEKIVKHCIGLMSSNYAETTTLAIRTVACGFRILRHDENTLLPLIHQIWPALVCRLTEDHNKNLEVRLSAFECLISMAFYSRDFIKRRALDTIIPKLCLFLESQYQHSLNQRVYYPYCMTIAYKCQFEILTYLGQLAYHTQVAYKSLWRIICVVLRYLDGTQAPPLRDAARISLKYLIALDADCVWYYAKQENLLTELPFDVLFKTV